MCILLSTGRVILVDARAKHNEPAEPAALREMGVGDDLR
jgi:hypothetical protein